MDKKTVAIVVMSGNSMMDFAGPADVFRHANNLRDVYHVVLVSPCADQALGTGLQLSDTRLTDIAGSIDTLLIAGSNASLSSEQFYSWLAEAHQGIRRIGAIGINSAAMAKLTLLNGKRAAMHLQNGNINRQKQLLINVDHHPFHSRDGHSYTSGGVSSGIDLALAMVEEDCGRGVAADVARKLIFFYLNRQVYQVQFGNLITASPVAAQLKEWLSGRLHEPLDVSHLAENMNMSPRNFTRVFTRQTGMPPAKFIEKLRVEAACACLEKSEKSLEEIALLYGLGGLVSMRRIFLRHLLVTPSDYRRLLKLHNYENSN